MSSFDSVICVSADILDFAPLSGKQCSSVVVINWSQELSDVKPEGQTSQFTVAPCNEPYAIFPAFKNGLQLMNM